MLNFCEEGIEGNLTLKQKQIHLKNETRTMSWELGQNCIWRVLNIFKHLRTQLLSKRHISRWNFPQYKKRESDCLWVGLQKLNFWMGKEKKY